MGMGWAWIVTIALLIGSAIAFPERQFLYSSVVTAVPRIRLETLVTLIASKGLLILVATATVVGLWCLARSRERLSVFACAGVGVVIAYLLSEGIKILVSEPRPCASSMLTTALTCPDPGDWSWPSNHSVLAAAFATACVLALSRTKWIVVPVAIVIASSRVAAGVHYVHDVLSGLALGVVTVCLVVVLLHPVWVRFANSEQSRLRHEDGQA